MKCPLPLWRVGALLLISAPAFAQSTPSVSEPSPGPSVAASAASESAASESAASESAAATPAPSTETAPRADEPPRERPPWASEASLETIDEPPPSSARTNLFIAGSAVTVGFYGLGFGTSYLWPHSPVAEDLRIPIVGAYSAVFNAGCGNGERGCGTFVAALRTTFAALSALGQTGGVLMLGEALFMDTASSGSSSARGSNTSSYSSAGQNGASSPEDGAVGAVPGGQSQRTPTQLYYAPVVDEHSFGLSIGGSF